MRWLCLILAVLFFSSCSEKRKKTTVTVFAAAGTRVATTDICKLVESKGELSVDMNFASSGTLARQIEMGAEADLFVSANKQWVDYLATKDLLDSSSVREIAANTLVVISSKKDSLEQDIFQLINGAVYSTGLIAIGDPSYVPVGKYAKSALCNLNAYEKLKDRFVLAKDVSSVLKYVELGECDWGMVYYSEAICSDKVNVLTTVPDSLHPPIRFYMAHLKQAQNKVGGLSSAFMGKEGQSILKKHGFSTMLN